MDAVNGRIFFDRDIHLYWLAQMQGFRDVVRAGGLPLWDPHVSFGHPMLANPNTQVLYPRTWLSLLLEPGAYYTIYALLHLLAAGTGLLALARRAGASRLAATVAGLLFMGSGPLLSLPSQWHHFGAACLAPWVLVAAEDLRTSPGPRRAVVLGLAIAAQALVGSPTSHSSPSSWPPRFAVRRSVARAPGARVLAHPREPGPGRARGGRSGGGVVDSHPGGHARLVPLEAESGDVRLLVAFPAGAHATGNARSLADLPLHAAAPVGMTGSLGTRCCAPSTWACPRSGSS